MPFINRVGGGAGIVGTTLKDVMDQIVSYKSVITVNGEERNNLLVQPSDFSEVNYLEPNTSYGDLSVVEDVDAEGGNTLLIAKSGSSSSGNANLLHERVSYETTIPNTTSGGAYLISARMKGSDYVNSPTSAILVTPKYAITGYDYDSSPQHFFVPFASKVLPSYLIYHFLINVPDSKYLARVSLALSLLASGSGANPRPDYYIDWMSVYDVTGIDLTAYDAPIQSAY